MVNTTSQIQDLVKSTVVGAGYHKISEIVEYIHRYHDVPKMDVAVAVGMMLEAGDIVFQYPEQCELKPSEWRVRLFTAKE